MKGNEEISKVNVDEGFQAYNVANSLIKTLDCMDQKIIGFMSSYANLIIRISLGIVFVWFGLLKVAGVSPVFDLASHVVYWLPPRTICSPPRNSGNSYRRRPHAREGSKGSSCAVISSACGHISRAPHLAGGSFPRRKSSVSNHPRRVCDKEPSSHRSRAGGRGNSQTRMQKAAAAVTNDQRELKGTK
jgi:hypothetical protein